jgi:hypothetical protein
MTMDATAAIHHGDLALDPSRPELPMQDPRSTSFALVTALTVLGAASCSSSTGVTGTDGGKEAATTRDVGVPDTSKHDAHPLADSGTKDTGVHADAGGDSHASDATANDGGPPEAGSPDVVAHDGGHGPDARSDAAPDGGYPSCAASWLTPPTLPSVDGGTTLEIPADAGTLKVILHGQVKSTDGGPGGGTQNYVCTEAVDAGTYSWVLTGPDAHLDDCNGTFLIEHTASDAGATRPQWASQIDTSIVVGKKVDTVTVSASAVPWLLLQAVSTSGTGLLNDVKYVQRVNTSGGVATTPCDAAHVGSTVDVPYTADYYFYGL